MNGLTHGSVHVNVGGHWGVDATIFDELGWTTHREQFLLIAKGLWRKGLVRCPATCDDDDACACDCSAALRRPGRTSKLRPATRGARSPVSPGPSRATPAEFLRCHPRATPAEFLRGHPRATPPLR
jgi:hypothetical protein